jgi:DNA-binding NarL/FixJ family response regulator
LTEKIRIVVADDHPVVRDGLVAILNTQADFEVTGEAGDGAELVRLALAQKPDIVMTDLEMPQTDGADMIRQIREHLSQTHIIVFTAFDTDGRILSAIQAGANGYLLKGAPRDEIFRAIRVVSQGGSLLEPTVASRLLAHISGRPDSPTLTPLEPLTEREMEVLALLGKGKTNKEIGVQLFITERTVKFYVSAILSKLEAGNRTEAVTIAAQRGLITLS